MGGEVRMRSYLGGAALALACFGLFLLVLAIPFTIFQAHFWGGFGYHEGRQPTAAQLEAAVSREFWWGVWHRLVPLFVMSVSLFGYGFYEARKERSFVSGDALGPRT